MKRSLCKVLFTAMAFMSSIAAWAVEHQYVDGINWYYEIVDGQCSIVRGVQQEAVYPKPNGSVSIPKKLGETTVTRIGQYAFYQCSGITNVVIPTTVTYIGKYAFSGCTKLAKLTVPDKVTDIDENRLERARQLFPKELVEKTGVQLTFVNTRDMADPAQYLRDLVGGGYDDVFAYAPVESVVELSSAILGRDGCLNFFAGPTDNKFSARINFYDVHYNSAHVIGSTGGNTADMVESLELTAAGRIRPAVMVTHVGGLDCVAETTLNLPKIPGGKKLIYTHLIQVV